MSARRRLLRIAHRGASGHCPENTRVAFLRAIESGADMVELDCQRTRDGALVILHDETLERTTNGRGRVCDTPDAVLFRLDAGDGEPVPTLAAAAALCREYGLLANVEIKPAAGHELRTAEVVARLAGQLWHGAAVPPLFSSFSLAALEVARDLAPQIPRGILYGVAGAGWPDDLRRLGAVSLHCAAARLSDAVLAEAAALGVPVLGYTVNDPAKAEKLFRRGVSALFTDRLDRFASETVAYKGLQSPG